MLAPKPILAFLGRFAVIFGLLIAPWPGWEDAYAHFLQKSAGVLTGAYGSRGIHMSIAMSKEVSLLTDFGSYGSHAILAFAPNPTTDPLLDTIVYVGNRAKDAHGQRTMKFLYFSSRYWAYLPTALVAALVLSTANIGWRRRLGALGWGLLWINVYITCVLTVMIQSTIYKNPDLGLGVPSPFWHGIVSFLHEFLAAHVGTHLAIAVPIWILVTFRRDDWEKLLGQKTVAR